MLLMALSSLIETRLQKAVGLISDSNTDEY